MIQNIVFRIPSCPLSAVYVSIEEERLLDGVETINVQTCGRICVHLAKRLQLQLSKI